LFSFPDFPNFQDFPDSEIMKKKVKTYTISAVSELYEIHPQTLRLYEREGLLKPSRSIGNTRLYEDSDLERLEIILSLTRDLGVNLAGVEIILNMREKMDAMQREFERFFDYIRNHANDISANNQNLADSEALIPISRMTILQKYAVEIELDDE
jgi:MerR family transcriptional regulator, heat shock protein HspR